MKTVLYLIHHGATEGSLAQPPLLQGRRQNPPLAPVGIRQAEATRDFLAIRPVEHCYSSPLQPAVQTATIVAAPHGLSPILLDGLTEPEGESLSDVYRRAHQALEELWNRHAGEAILVVGHEIVNRTYLAGVLGLSPDQGWQVTLQDCGISVLVREGEKTTVSTLNAAFHLQGVAA
jgi:broad specificity phosphatase PhoE